MVSTVFVATLVLSFLSAGGCMFVAVCVACCKADAKAKKMAPELRMVCIENPDGSACVGVALTK